MMTTESISSPLEARPRSALLQNLSSFQQSSPVDILGFAETLGLAVWEDDLPEGVSGKLFPDATNGGAAGFSVVVNANEDYRRKRFTIAHEVAHFMLHRGQVNDEVVDDTFYRSTLSSKQEAEANALAASILMPYSLIDRLREEGTASVEALADRLEVSKEAMMVRLGIPLA